MVILGIETSCDETAAAVLTNNNKRITILSNIVASSAPLQAKYGGVIPEQAARQQLKFIIPVIEEALHQASITGHPELVSGSQNKMLKQVQHDNKKIISDIDAIAVAYGPGLIGSLLVGVETAKTLAFLWNKPLIPVNHLIGHFYANWIQRPFAISHSQLAESYSQKQTAKSKQPKFPCIGLLVSGGHTDLLLFKDHGKYTYLGGTRDDASGECFDKCARLLSLPYPGGPEISKLAREGNPAAFDLPRPMIDSKNWEFSFSGLKTAVANILQGHSLSIQGVTLRNSSEVKCNLAASIEATIIDVLVAKTIKAVQVYHVNQIMIAGGVAANRKLANELKLKIENLKLKIKLGIPVAELCTDNAAMIAAAAFYNFHPTDPLSLQADPSLAL